MDPSIKTEPNKVITNNGVGKQQAAVAAPAIKVEPTKVTSVPFTTTTTTNAALAIPVAAAASSAAGTTTITQTTVVDATKKRPAVAAPAPVAKKPATTPQQKSQLQQQIQQQLQQQLQAQLQAAAARGQQANITPEQIQVSFKKKKLTIFLFNIDILNETRVCVVLIASLWNVNFVLK
jgi:hypothetical protein